MVDLGTGVILLSDIQSAISPGESRTFLELLGALLGVTKWPVLGLVVVAAGIAVGQYDSNAKEQGAGYWAAFLVACGAGGWFLASVLIG